MRNGVPMMCASVRNHARTAITTGLVQTTQKKKQIKGDMHALCAL